ncbi:MAG TPA: hypothetical protein VKR58_04360, partial [Aquella sp.]|nr:hypothetical protein [Aquella sp.]
MDNSDKSKLAIFSNIVLSKEQVETILGRTISNNEFKQYLGKKIKKHVRTRGQKIRTKVNKFIKSYYKDLAIKKLKDSLLTNPDVIKKQNERSKKQWKSIADEVTEIAKRRMIQKDIKTNVRDSLKLHMAFKHSNYAIVKLTDRYVDKFKTREARWMIEGDINLFSLNEALKSLLTKMTEKINPNSKVQIVMTDIESNRYYRTSFLSIEDLEDELLDVFDMFTEYPDFNINSIIFESFSIDLPSGSGYKANKIIDTENSRCILRIKNNDSLCLVKSIIAGLSITNIDKLQETFKGKLNEEEIKKLNYG